MLVDVVLLCGIVYSMAVLRLSIDFCFEENKQWIGFKDKSMRATVV